MNKLVTQNTKTIIKNTRLIQRLIEKNLKLNIEILKTLNKEAVSSITQFASLSQFYADSLKNKNNKREEKKESINNFLNTTRD